MINKMKDWLLLAILVLTINVHSQPSDLETWGYSLGTVADKIWSEDIQFFKGCCLIHSFSGGGVTGSIESYKEDDIYFWSGGFSRTFFNNKPLPDRISLHWVSFSEKKRYRATLNLPHDLDSKIQQMVWCDIFEKENKKPLSRIGIGVAPGGYAEVYLYNSCHVDYKVIARAYGKPFQTKRDKRITLERQYRETLLEFEQKHPNLYKNHPLPDPKDWPYLIKPRYELRDMY